MSKSILTWLLIIINIIGFLFGIYYYQPQLSQTPFGYWLLVIDCPLFVLFFALILLFDVRDNFWNFFVSAGLIKYGLWTVSVILLLWDQFVSIAPVMYPLLAIAHAGMTLEFIFLLPRMRADFNNFRVIPIFLLMDYFDYFKNLHPRLPEGAPIDLIMIFSFASSIVIPILLNKFILYYRHHKFEWESALRQATRKESVASARKEKKLRK